VSDIFWLLSPAVAAAVLAFGLTPLVARFAVRVGAMDVPDERKVHARPVPRLGGLAVVASIAIVFAGAQWLSAGRWQLPSSLAAGVGLGVLPILLVSIVDDIRSVRARRKLAAHALGAVIAVSLGISLAPVVHLFGVPIEIGRMAWPLSVLWIVGVTNAFNLIDGLDGLSAGLALIAAVSMAAVFTLVGQSGMAGVSLVLAGALVGFLPYNLHPARLFLGDTGATAIGFCLAAFALRGGSTLSSGFAALLPVFIVGLPIADTLIAMARRTLHRLEHHTGGVFQADRDHIHHRLLALGVSHGTVVLLLYAAGLLFAAAALLSIFLNAREAGLMVTALLLAGIVGIRRLGYDEFAFIRRGTVLSVYELPVVKRGFFVVLVDLVLTFAAAYVAVGLKTDLWLLAAVRDRVVEIGTTLAPITVMVFSWRGMYRGSWRVAGLQDLTRVLLAVAVATSAGALVLRVVSSNDYPLSLFGIYGVVSLLLTASIRASYVILASSVQRSRQGGVPVLIYGAGRRGAAAVRELFQNQAFNLHPVGFIDDDWQMRDKIVAGVPVLGTAREMEHALRVTAAGGVVISSDKIASDRIERAAEACRVHHGTLFHLDIGIHRMEAGGDGRAPQASRHDQRQRVAPAGAADALDAWHDCQPCPSCKGGRVHRSKARNLYERFRKSRTDKRLYRCEECAWRGWLIPLEFGMRTRSPVPPAPDLRSLRLPPSA
jgi:UDP-GlcNAc:undecaprenyl-phosphate GlcNAc-1-phosphate transferase